LHDANGELVAAAKATWITLNKEEPAENRPESG
jgi:hypothetical protein